MSGSHHLAIAFHRSKSKIPRNKPFLMGFLKHKSWLWVIATQMRLPACWKGRVRSFLRITAGMVALTGGGDHTQAHQSPATCNANNFFLRVAKNANNVTNGTVVQFVATVENPSGLSGGQQGCDIILGTAGLLFICPGPDGQPTGTTNVLI